MKRIGFGLLWFVAFFFIGVFAIGALVGDPAPDVQTAHDAGYAIGQKYGRYLVLGSLVAAAVGTYFRLLPGTKQKARSNG